MAKSATRKTPNATPKSDNKIGKLPEWNLDDLYPGMDSPALKRDLEEGDAECLAFEQDFKGKLAEMGGPAAVRIA